MGENNGEHLFFKCKCIKRFWREMEMEALRTEFAAKQSLREIVVRKILSLLEGVPIKLVIGLWHWSSERNRTTRSGKARRGRPLNLHSLLSVCRLPTSWNWLRWNRVKEVPDYSDGRNQRKMHLTQKMAHSNRLRPWLDEVLWSEDRDVVIVYASSMGPALEQLHAEVAHVWGVLMWPCSSERGTWLRRLRPWSPNKHGKRSSHATTGTQLSLTTMKPIRPN